MIIPVHDDSSCVAFISFTKQSIVIIYLIFNVF